MKKIVLVALLVLPITSVAFAGTPTGGAQPKADKQSTEPNGARGGLGTGAFLMVTPA
jgi:hypothetical protein